MPGMRQPGMDNDFYDWSPISSRPPLQWPESARVALCPTVNLEHYEWHPPKYQGVWKATGEEIIARYTAHR